MRHLTQITAATFAAGTAAIAAAPAMFGGAIPAALLPAMQQDLVAGPWSSYRQASSDCPKIYLLEWRGCPFCAAFMRQDYAGLERSGYDVRIHYAAVGSESSGALAEIAYRRNIAVTLAHTTGKRLADGPDPADAGGARLAAFNAMVRATQSIRDASRRAGYRAYLPSFVWQDRSGQWRIHSGFAAGDTARIVATMPIPARECRVS